MRIRLGHRRQPVATMWSQGNHSEPPRFLVGMRRPLTCITASHSPDAIANIRGAEEEFSAESALSSSSASFDRTAQSVGIGFRHPARVSISTTRSPESALLRQSARQSGHLRLGSFVRADVARFFHEYGRRKPSGANRCHDIMRNMFHMRCRLGPSARNRREPLFRYRTLPPPASRAVRLPLLTGCRPGEIRRLRWREVKSDCNN